MVGKVDPDGAKGINGIVFEQANEGYQMLALPNSLGEKAIGDDGLSVDGIINTEGWIKAMTFVHDLYESGLAPRGLTSTENQSTFTSGKTIFLIGGSWVANSEFADGFEWGYTSVSYTHLTDPYGEKRFYFTAEGLGNPCGRFSSVACDRGAFNPGSRT